MEQKGENMYHIANDKRAKKSAEKSGNGLISCLKRKSFTEITVTDVQKAAGVGRATFYRLFDNITDVLSYLCDGIFEKIGCEYEGMNEHGSKETSLKFIQAWMDNKSLLKAIVDCERMDILYGSHAKYIGRNADFFFPDLSMSKEQLNYLLTTMTACIAACLSAWLKNGAYETAEQLQNRLSDCFKALSAVFS